MKPVVFHHNQTYFLDSFDRPRLTNNMVVIAPFSVGQLTQCTPLCGHILFA
jgi:hypothetical protein